MKDRLRKNEGIKGHKGKRLLRFKDLKKLGFVSSRVQLKRMIADGRFPPPIRLGPNSVAWLGEEYDAVIDKLIDERDSEIAS